MSTNLDIDQKLLAQAMRLGKHRTKTEAVNAVLSEYVQLREQQGIIDIFGTVGLDPSYDYKAQRKKR